MTYRRHYERLFPDPGSAYMTMIASAYSCFTTTALLYHAALLGGQSKRPVRFYWLANAGDVSMKIERDRKPTVSWRGYPRRHTISSVPFNWLWNLLVNSFLRRVRPVETIPYALIQNLFAVGAIALIIIRTVVLVSQLQKEDFLTRIVVQECARNEYAHPLVLIGYAEDQHRNNTPPIQLDDSYEYAVNLGFLPWGSVLLPPIRCHFRKLHKLYQYEDGHASWVRSYSCWELTIAYNVTARNPISDQSYDSFPRLWLAPLDLLDDPGASLVPFLTRPVEIRPSTYTDVTMSLKTRRFITSSGLKDAMTGSQPSYHDVDFYSAETEHLIPITSAPPTCVFNTSSIVSCGYIHQRKGLIANHRATNEQISHRAEALYCEAIEDYRKSSPLDALGSIGGLFALLQGTHTFLFGRPLFWGMFGAKIIAPFGIIGRFATKGFQQRLKDHYARMPTSEHPYTDQGNDSAETVRMSRFLLDYVVDMGPAAPSDAGASRKGELPGEEWATGSNNQGLHLEEQIASHRPSTRRQLSLLAEVGHV